MLTELNPKIDSTVAHYFNEIYKECDISQGLNLISFEIAKRYISNFLSYELACINKGDEIIIEAIESKMAVAIDIPELQTPIQLIGTIDRIDMCNGTRRIIDYKTTQVSRSDMELVNWDDIQKDNNTHRKRCQIMTKAD